MYNTSDLCYDFEKETNNSKTEDSNYWKVSRLITLAKQCEQKKINEFSVYHTKYETPLKTNKVYDALHTLHYELKGKDTKRLYISFGLVCRKIGNQNYRNFLFNVPLKLSLINQEITLETDTFSSKIFSEQYFVELLDVHFKNEHTTIVEQRKREVLLSIDKATSAS